MSGMLEQSVEDIEFLKGATVTNIEVVNEGEEFGFDALSLTFKLATPIKDAETQQVANVVEIQVWMDPEGNGPGYLALTRMA